MFTCSNVAFFAVVYICCYIGVYSIVDRICRCVETKYVRSAFVELAKEDNIDGKEEKE